MEWEIAAIDAGNRTIAACNGDGEFINLPSVIAEVNPYDDLPQDCPASAIIHYHNGKAAERDSRFVIGRLAREIGGIQTFTGDKSELAGRLVLAGLELPEGTRQAVIKRLVLCTPNVTATDKVNAMKDQLFGVHTFDRNGVGLTINIQNVVCQPETKGAYNFAKANHLFKWNDHPNGILDLGGKTSIGQIYLPSGMAPTAGRVVLPGTYLLAQMIAENDPALVGLDNYPDLGIIMDGIASQDYLYGLDICFKDTFHKQLPKWLEELRNKVKLGWSQYLSELGEVLMIGGSAPLAKSVVVNTSGRFKIAENHSTINVQGMQLSK